jgi:hypothetical protein
MAVGRRSPLQCEFSVSDFFHHRDRKVHREVVTDLVFKKCSERTV